MQGTQAKIEQIPEIYRDFLLTLKPVVDSRQEVLKINGVHLGMIFSSLIEKYSYEPPQIREIAENLKDAGWVEEDQWNFFKPTDEGERLIEVFARHHALVTTTTTVPPLPKL